MKTRKKNVVRKIKKNNEGSKKIKNFAMCKKVRKREEGEGGGCGPDRKVGSGRSSIRAVVRAAGAPPQQSTTQPRDGVSLSTWVVKCIKKYIKNCNIFWRKKYVIRSGDDLVSQSVSQSIGWSVSQTVSQ